VGTLASAAVLARGPAFARTRVPRIGYLRFVRVAPPYDEAFRGGLRDLGYVIGQTILIEERFADGRLERLAEMAAELVRLEVDVIVAVSTQATEVARRATRTIPIVFPVTFDPVASGFVASLARPGGNLTGLSPLNPTVTAKRVELLRELLPRVARAAVLRNPTNPGSAFVLRETETAARDVGLTVQAFEARAAGEIDAAVAAAARSRAEALLVISDALFFSEQARLVDLGRRHRLPTMFDTPEFVSAGGLMSYGTDLVDLYRRAATYVHKILRGARPADLPVEQATKFDLVLNQRTARALGLTIPASLLLRADRVIE
jgi:putative tryptophan/tyrosine transport system substrate-binding protein